MFVKPSRALSVFAAFVLAMCVTACGGGGGSGSDASVQKTAVVIGQLAATKAALVTVADAVPITVHVLSDPAIQATVAADGTFTLRGLPEGSFTLVFMQGATEVGRLVFGEVAANQQITITVQLFAGEVVLVGEDRRGIGDAGVELEGPVQNVIVVNPAGDSRFVIRDRSVVARPGVTAIRQGNTPKTVNDVTVGRQVHVTGTTLKDSTDVLAYQMILQGPATDTPSGSSGGGEKQMTICHIPPGNPAKKVTITVGESAWPAHQAHGDTEGACK
jgi:hypothetical protein